MPLKWINELTMRDYFAGQAIVATYDGCVKLDDAAKEAYRVADYMLKERERLKKTQEGKPEGLSYV